MVERLNCTMSSWVTVMLKVGYGEILDFVKASKHKLTRDPRKIIILEIYLKSILELKYPNTERNFPRMLKRQK